MLSMMLKLLISVAIMTKMLRHSQIPPQIRKKRREISVLASAAFLAAFFLAISMLCSYPSVRISEMFRLFLSPWTDEILRALLIIALSELLVLGTTEQIRRMYDRMGEWQKGNIVFALQSVAIAALFLVDTFFVMGFPFGQWLRAPARMIDLIGFVLTIASSVAAGITANIWLRA